MTAIAEEPARPARPVTVSVAFWLQLAAVAVLLVVIGLAVVGAVQADDQITRAAETVGDADPDEVSGERLGNVVSAVVIGMSALFLAVWLAATARPVRRGGYTARVLVYVGAGLQLLVCVGQSCLGALFVPFAFGAEGDWTEAEDGELVWEESEFSETLYGSADLTSDILSAGILGGMALVFALTVAVVLLVTLPPADRYFARPADRPAPVGPVPPPYPFGPLPPYGGAPGGHPLPPVYALPPGYLICPDPARHLPPAPEAGRSPEAGASPDAGAPPEGPPPMTNGS